MADKDQTIDALITRARLLVRKLDVTVAGMERKLQNGGRGA